MENIAGKIEWYHNLYLACLSGAAVFLALSVILFIRLDIRGVIGFFTGRQAERGIRELEQNGGKNKESRKHIKPELPKKYIIEKSGEPQRIFRRLRRQKGCRRKQRAVNGRFLCIRKCRISA